MCRHLWSAIVVAAGVGLVAGCGGGGAKAPGTADEGAKAALEELGDTLKSLAAEGQKPPTKLAELAPIEPRMAVAGTAVRSGDVVYVWGAAYAAGGTRIVAYEKKVPDEGGYVLLEDGTVKKLTADEFKSAPKAK